MTRGFGGRWALVMLGSTLLAPGWMSATAQEAILSPVRYDLTVDLDVDRSALKGRARIFLENRTAEAIHEASFLLYRLMEVTEVEDGDGSALAYTQKVVRFEDFDRLQVNQIRVALDRPLLPGNKRTVELAYEGYLLGYSETGMSYVQDRITPTFALIRDDSYAYPQPGLPSIEAMRAAPEALFTYEATITVPDSMRVVNGGRHGPVIRGDGRASYSFTSLEPSWRMDFAAGQYAELIRGPVRIYYLAGDEEGAAGVARAAGKALSLFGEWFGPLDETSTLSFIEIPNGFGSQTDVTTIIQSAAAFQDPTRYREVYHELSHLWNVTATDRPAPRWEEGLASFLEYLVTETLDSRSVVDARADQLLDWLREQVPRRPAWTETPMVRYGEVDLTDLSYSVGAVFFDLLYHTVGPEQFRKIIGIYARDFKPGGSTDDFVSVAQGIASRDLSTLFQDWMFTTRWFGQVATMKTIEALRAHYREE